MAPKKAASGGSKKTAAAVPSHASYQDMIKEAIINLKDRNGSSRQQLKKYVLANNNLKSVSDSAFTTQFNRALQKGSDSGVFARPKGTSGPVKLANPKDKAPAAKPAAKSTTTKKATGTKKAAPAKRAATKKTTAKKASTAKSSVKANTGKPRKSKTPTAAPAVEDKAPVVTGKTKSGRVTKSKAPQAEKKPATKRKAPTKKAAPKKSTTPKKAAA